MQTLTVMTCAPYFLSTGCGLRRCGASRAATDCLIACNATDNLRRARHRFQARSAKADQFRKEVMARGSTDTEADKQAQKEAASNRWPDKLLLQARLLNDGGYHREALKLLHGKTASDFKSIEDQLEFSYRVGRLYDDIGADNEAIEFYKQAIEMGESRKEYYAARAALQIGFILELKGDKTNAITWFQRCLDMKDHDFKNSLDQKAKAGIARCKGE